jgi:transposase
MALTVSVEVPPGDREVLASWLRSTSIRAGLAQRARIVLLAADGTGTNEIARRAGVSKPTVILWKKRYADEGTGGLEDRPRPGKPRSIDDVAVVLDTLEPPPERLGVTHWSSRLLAAGLGLSNVKVAKVWREYGLQPWRAGSFKFSTGPQLEARVRDVVGLYLNPRTRPSSCASTRTRRPRLWKEPPLCCRCGPGSRKSAAATTSGTAPPRCSPPWRSPPARSPAPATPRHRHEELLKSLRQVAKAYPRRQLHIVTDNYGTRKHPGVQAWLAKPPRLPCTSRPRRDPG